MFNERAKPNVTNPYGYEGEYIPPNFKTTTVGKNQILLPETLYNLALDLSDKVGQHPKTALDRANNIGLEATRLDLLGIGSVVIPYPDREHILRVSKNSPIIDETYTPKQFNLLMHRKDFMGTQFLADHFGISHKSATTQIIFNGLQVISCISSGRDPFIRLKSGKTLPYKEFTDW